MASMLITEIKKYLAANSWVEVQSNCVFENDKCQIVFDTGSYVEVYDKATGKRLKEGLVHNLDSFISVIEHPGNCK